MPVIAASATDTVTLAEAEPTCDPFTLSVTPFERTFELDCPAVPDEGSLSTPWLMVAVLFRLRTIALNSITIYSESESESELVTFPRLNVTFVPLVNGLPRIAVPGTTNVGETELLLPLITNPAPDNLLELIQLAPPLQTNAILAVLSLRNCKPLGISSISWTFVNDPSGNLVAKR